MTLRDVPIRRGPNPSFEEIGVIFDGQTARLTGSSFVNDWLRVICPDDTVGDCTIYPGGDDVTVIAPANP